MDLHPSDAQSIEGAIAKAARIVATFQKHLGPICRPEVQGMMQSTLEDLAGALSILDPSADGADFEAHIKKILEREGRKTIIADAR